MKFKNIVIIAIIIAIGVIGYNIINDESDSGSGSGSGSGIFSTGVEKDLAASLPDDLTVCYCIDNSGEKILNNLEVKSLKIDRQSTQDKFKSADCTIELEGNDIKMTAYVNLSCIKYDDGSWQVESTSELSKPKVVPKYRPDESSFIWNIQRYEELYSLVKANEYVDMENGEIAYFYNVLDVGFTGNGVSCTAVFRDTGMDYYDKDVYYWGFSNEIN